MKYQEKVMPLYIVDTISTFRHRYIIECDERGHATDTVVMEEAEEVSQFWLGESIIEAREITRDDLLVLEKQADDNKELHNFHLPHEQLIHVVDYPHKHNF